MSRLESLTTDGTDKFVDAFNHTDFKLIEADVSLWGKYSQSYMTETELKGLICDVAEQLELTPEYAIDMDDGDYKRTAHFTRQSKDGTVQIKVSQKIEEVEKSRLKVENFLIVGITLNNKCKSIVYYKKKMDNIFDKLGIQPNDSLTITSRMNGHIDKSTARKAMNHVLNYLDGQVKEDFQSSEIYSIYAYSDYIDEHVITNGKKINVDLAVTYNEEENCTYLYGAIPVITIDY